MSTLYLSRLLLNPRLRWVQRDLADCYAMHQRILSGFPDAAAVEHARERFGVLYRVELGREGPTALIQSHEAPDWSILPANYLALPPQVKPIDGAYAGLSTGSTLLFRLRANTTKRISDRNEAQGAQWRGKRIDLRRESDQIDWLAHKSLEAGFRLLTVRVRSGLDDGIAAAQGHREHADVAEVRVTRGGTIHGTRHEPGGNRRMVTFGGATFDGQLQVTDVERFRHALESGIGPAKAFGFGLLSIAPVAAHDG